MMTGVAMRIQGDLRRTCVIAGDGGLERLPCELANLASALSDLDHWARRLNGETIPGSLARSTECALRCGEHLERPLFILFCADWLPALTCEWCAR